MEVWETHRNVLLSSSRIEVVITFSSCLALQEDANKDFIKSNMPNKGILRNHHELGEDPKSSTTSVEEMVAVGLLTPGCRGTAPDQYMNQAFPQLPSGTRTVPALSAGTWGVPKTQLGLCPWVTSSAGLSSSSTVLLTRPRCWADSCLFRCLRWGWMWEKWTFQPGKMMKILFLL